MGGDDGTMPMTMLVMLHVDDEDYENDCGDCHDVDEYDVDDDGVGDDEDDKMTMRVMVM